MKVIIFGATGMIGAGTLLECLDDARVERVLAVVRKPTGVRHAKLEEALHRDFYDYSSLQARGPSSTPACSASASRRSGWPKRHTGASPTI